VKISFICNGKPVSVDASPEMRALDVIRDLLSLTGTKEGCGKGECGACTVLVDGEPVNSCILFAPKLEGKNIETIEGVKGKEGGLHPLQEAFLEEGAVQCGFCTPGMILTSKALLDKNPSPDEAEIETALSGNICRCTGYGKIVKALRRVSEAGKNNG
jgi:aerobic-type carbon monoxide dehydrogenase small subunit (CoxS/CutS family)